MRLDRRSLLVGLMATPAAGCMSLPRIALRAALSARSKPSTENSA